MRESLQSRRASFYHGAKIRNSAVLPLAGNLLGSAFPKPCSCALMMVGKPSPNQTTINNLTESQTKGVSGGPSAPYGRYGNIFLSQTEYDELQAEYPDRLERFIEEMSRYLAANGKSYQNYAAALRIWAGNDKKEAPKKGIPDYSCKEGESL